MEVDEDAEVELASELEAVVELDVVEDVVDVVLCTSLSHTVGHNHNVRLKSQGGSFQTHLVSQKDRL